MISIWKNKNRVEEEKFFLSKTSSAMEYGLYIKKQQSSFPKVFFLRNKPPRDRKMSSALSKA